MADNLKKPKIVVYTAVRQLRPGILRDVYQVVVDGRKVFSREISPDTENYLDLQREIAISANASIPRGVKFEDILAVEGEIYLESSPIPRKIPEWIRASFYANLFNEFSKLNSRRKTCRLI